MTRNRRRKMEIRAQQASTGVPYLEAMRQTLSPTTAATPAPVSPQVELRPPLAAWRRPVYCRYWADLIARHGELIALTISDGDGWWGLDDLARGVAGALQERPAGERGVWIGIGGGYKATKREHLAGIAAALDGAGALRRLTVRVLPDPAVCQHPSCRRRRGEPPIEKTGAGNPPARPAAPRGVMTLGPSLSLAEVMEAHPTLGYAGFRVFDSRLSREKRDQQLHFNREHLRDAERQVQEVLGWLRANITPIKTPTTGSYVMKHVVEDLLGRYVSNGELVAATLMAGYPWKGPFGPNATFGMRKKDVDRVQAARQELARSAAGR